MDFTTKQFAASVITAVCLATTLPIFSAPAFAGPHEDGKTAYQSKDYARALTFWTRSAQEGNPKSLYNLGLLYDNGFGVQESNKQALLWYEKSAELGFDLAQYQTGVMYSRGIGTKVSQIIAASWFTKAAEHGHAKAQYELGKLYEWGRGAEQSYTRSTYWYRKAAEQGNARAEYNMGTAYNNGYGVEKSPERALYWYEKSAAKGDDNAIQLVSLIKADIVKRKRIEPVEKFTQDHRAKRGPQPQSSTPSTSQSTKETGWDAIISDTYNQYIAVMGPDATLKLAIMDFEDEKYAKAFPVFAQFANEGNPKAMYILGVYYENGYTVEKSNQKAAKWYELAAEKGVPNAQHNIGLFYQNGRGVVQSYIKAHKWFKLASENGKTKSMLLLASMHYNGQGVPKSPDKAKEWVQKAADVGDEYAKQALIDLANGNE